MSKDRPHAIDVTIDNDQWCDLGHLSKDLGPDQKKWDEVAWTSFFERILLKVAAVLGVDKPFGLSILLTDNHHIQELNHNFRGKNKPTNVLSFPSGIEHPSPDGFFFLGDVAFAHDVIVEESNTEKKIFLNHMTHLTIHGILHLLGYDHEIPAEAETMENLEILILSHFNIRNPYT